MRNFAIDCAFGDDGQRRKAGDSLRAAIRAEVAAERQRWSGEVALLRATMEGAAHQLSQARIWGGMAWHYNPLHPMYYKPALERMRQVLDRA